MTLVKNCQTLHNKKIFDTILQDTRNYGGKKYDRSGAQDKDNGNTYLE